MDEESNMAGHPSDVASGADVAAKADVVGGADVTNKAVGDLIARIRGLDETPTPTARLGADLGCGSFDMMVIAVEAEAAFGVVFDFKAAAGVLTVSDLARAIRSMRPASSADALPDL